MRRVPSPPIAIRLPPSCRFGQVSAPRAAGIGPCASGTSPACDAAREPKQQGDDSLSNDRRAFPRHEVRRDGRILFPDQPYFIECAIRNMSEDGALLSMLVCFPLPREILLWEEKTGTIYECDVRWRREHMVGVHFSDVCGRMLRRALLERCFAPLSCGSALPPSIH
jgi:hypothetical protein